MIATSRASVWRWAVLVPVAVAVISMFVLGCSVQEHYELLSFFFDGVPDPNAPAETSPAQTLAMEGNAEGQLTPRRPVVIYTSHKPFADQQCGVCHDSPRGRFIPPKGSDICKQCHENVAEGLAVVHGPVAVKDCRWCHTPHESPYPALLRAKPKDVCLQCHEMQDVFAPDLTAHQDPDRSCVDCHYGHGGKSRPFLKPSWDQAPPLDPPPDLPAPPSTDPTDARGEGLS
jgi:predicted CXXCH cytochrome family protein